MGDQQYWKLLECRKSLQDQAEVKASVKAVLGSHSVLPGKKLEASESPLTEVQESRPFQPAVKE